MLAAQFRDGQGKWVNIPMNGLNANPESLAFQYCKQHGVHTRVANITEGKEPVEVKVYSCTRKH